MKRKFFIFACLLLAAQHLLGQSLRTEKINWKGKTMAAASDYVMVKLKDAGMEAALNTVLVGKELSLDSAPNVQNIARLKIESRTKSLSDLIDDLQNTGIFEFVEPDFVHYLCVTPNDTYYGNQYGPSIVEAPDAWEITTGSSSIVVGILDTGIPISSGSLSHPDLQNTSRIIQGVDYVGDGNGVKDERGHGTHVAGIAGAETNNSTGVAGMNWNSKLRIYQVFNANGTGFDSDFYDAVINAVDNDCKVINFSGGHVGASSTLENAAIYAENNDVLLVAAAGNYDEDANPDTVVVYPAAYSVDYDNVIAVSATDGSDNFASFSSYGPEVVVAAPGVNIYSTTPNYSVVWNDPPYSYSQNYDYVSGTSMAAPLVAGLAALILSNDPSLSPAQVRETIEITADDLGPAGFDNEFGYGRVNAYNAVRYLYVPDIYSTIASALDAAVSGQTVIVSQGTYNETDNLTIDAGVTLTLESGTTINMTSSKKITVNGTLLASASSGSEIIFCASSGTWYGIEVNNGGHFNPSFCNFDNVQTAIRYYNADGDVHTCNFTDYSTALRYENSSSGRIDYSSMIEYGGTGIDAAQYAYPDARSYNAIEDNYYGVKADNTSNPVLGYSAGGGYNSLVNAVWDVYSTNYSTIYAVYNWWGSSSPSPNLYGDVDWEPYLDYNPLAKSNAAGNPNVVVPNFEPADTIGVSELNQALRLYFAEDYATVLPLLQNLVSKYADYNIGRQALALENQTLKKLSRSNEAFSRLLAVKQNYQDKEIAGLAQSIIVGLHVKNGEYEQAKNAAAEVLGNFSNTALEKYALYDLGMIHWYYLNDPKTGETYYRQLIAKYPDDDLAMSALATLGEWTPKPDKGNAPALTNTQNIPTEYALSQNFPNPFLSGAKSRLAGNPQTVIQYQLPEASHVTVKIYNLFGQEVRTLIAGHREAGYHAEIWDGRDDFGRRVASGVYFYRLSVEPNATRPNGFQFTRKMVLAQ
jgi:subtilisin family serine protease